MSWQFNFRRNIHMYCHSLKCRNGNAKFECQSEDSANEEKVTLFWLDDLPLKDDQLSEFASDLEVWASKQEFKYRILHNRECLATNVLS